MTNATFDEQVACALDLKRAWTQERRDQLAAGASAKTIQQIDDILESIRNDIRDLNWRRANNAIPDSVMIDPEANR